LAIRRTEVALMSSCLAIWRELLLVPGLSSCEQINSLTSAIFQRCVQTSAYHYLHDTSQMNQSHEPDGKCSAMYSSSSFCQNNLALIALAPSSLFTKCLNRHFVFITQFTHHKNISRNNKIVPVFQIITTTIELTTTGNGVENDVTCQRI